MSAARISVRKAGTRRGQPHYSAECATCGSVLAIGYLGRETAKALGEEHKRNGCAITMRWAANGGS